MVVKTDYFVPHKCYSLYTNVIYEALQAISIRTLIHLQSCDTGRPNATINEWAKYGHGPSMGTTLQYSQP